MATAEQFSTAAAPDCLTARGSLSNKSPGMKEITKRLGTAGATRLPGRRPRDPHCALLETPKVMATNRCQWRFYSDYLNECPEVQVSRNDCAKLRKLDDRDYKLNYFILPQTDWGLRSSVRRETERSGMVMHVVSSSSTDHALSGRIRELFDFSFDQTMLPTGLLS
ncbi:hypothetical protein T265_06095 [Opisthorchis viverrini]|uniref:Uncharacterized protein n=1 Tax=Opisthorchis viverrini TaxID=6198 RepID=A0A074ZHK2_OPIVI|nr:hypothetical protein T265_06095 [Opisthorchis viverrini]KER26733.1 hypothetical protein T265_06095 [Opisthorchis viverrini]